MAVETWWSRNQSLIPPCAASILGSDSFSKKGKILGEKNMPIVINIIQVSYSADW